MFPVSSKKVFHQQDRMWEQRIPTLKWLLVATNCFSCYLLPLSDLSNSVLILSCFMIGQHPLHSFLIGWCFHSDVLFIHGLVRKSLIIIVTQSCTNDQLSTTLTKNLLFIFFQQNSKCQNKSFKLFRFFPSSEKSSQSENTYIKSFPLSERKDNEIFVATHDFFDQFLKITSLVDMRLQNST